MGFPSENRSHTHHVDWQEGSGPSLGSSPGWLAQWLGEAPSPPLAVLFLWVPGGDRVLWQLLGSFLLLLGLAL